MTHHFKVIHQNLPPHFLRATLKRPWMRMFIFLDDGPLSRTPEHYKKFVYDWKVKTPKPVHYIPETGIWKKTEDGEIIPVNNIPIPLLYPIEMNEGIWGGEGVIKGFHVNKEKVDKQRKNLFHFEGPEMAFVHPYYAEIPDGKGTKMQRRGVVDPLPKYWVPRLQETVLYSEILNKHMKTVVTFHALRLIDEYYGLDNYLLKSEPCDLMSVFALKLKRELLFNLIHKSLYPDDPQKREEVYNKYKDFIIPEEEVDWFGLTLSEAYRKQDKLEVVQRKIGPYKHIFRKEFIEQLKEAKTRKHEESEEDNKKTVLQRLSNLTIFSSKKDV